MRTERHHRHGVAVVTAPDIQRVAAQAAYRIAGRLLHAVYVRVFRQGFVRLRSNAHAGTAGDVIQYHRQVDAVGDVCEVLDKPFLRRLVVIWADHKYAVCPHELRVLGSPQNALRVVPADTGDDLHAPLGRVYHPTDDLTVLTAGERRVFAGRAAGNNRGGAVFILKLYVPLKLLVIDAGFRKRRDYRGAGTPKKRCFRHNSTSIFLSAQKYIFRISPHYYRPPRRRMPVKSAVGEECGRGT